MYYNNIVSFGHYVCCLYFYIWFLNYVNPNLRLAHKSNISYISVSAKSDWGWMFRRREQLWHLFGLALHVWHMNEMDSNVFFIFHFNFPFNFVFYIFLFFYIQWWFFFVFIISRCVPVDPHLTTRVNGKKEKEIALQIFLLRWMVLDHRWCRGCGLLIGLNFFLSFLLLFFNLFCTKNGKRKQWCAILGDGNFRNNMKKVTK